MTKSNNKKRNAYLPKYYLDRLQDRAHHATLLRGESFIYHFLGFVQTSRTAIVIETSS